MNDSRSPRQWLLTRNAHLAQELDERRRRALPSASMTWRELLHELVHPMRFVWSALAIVWVGLVVFRVIGSPPRPAHSEKRPSPAVLAAWIHQLKSHEAFAQIDRRP